MKKHLQIAAVVISPLVGFAQNFDDEFSVSAPAKSPAAPSKVEHKEAVPAKEAAPTGKEPPRVGALINLADAPAGAPTRTRISVGAETSILSDYDSEIRDPAIRLEIVRLAEIGSINVSTRANKKKTLSAIIRELCVASKMNFVLPNPEDFSEEVTLSTNDNPYRILRMLAATYGYEMEYKPAGRVWMFYRPDIGELITRHYKIRFDDLSESELTAPSFSSGGVGSGQGYRSGGGSGMNSNPGASGATTGSVKIKQQLAERLQKILDLPTTGLTAPVQVSDAVGCLKEIPSSAYAPKGRKVEVKGSIDFYQSTRTAVVRGTRMHHKLIESALAAFDQPGSQVQFAVQFLEISGTDNIKTGMDPTGLSNPSFTLSNLKSDPMNMKSGSMDPRPSGAILSMDDLTLRLNFLKSKAHAVTVDNPTVVTRNGQPFVFRNTSKEPVLSAENNFNAGSSVNSTQSIDYIEIGTILSVIPRVMDPDPSIGDGKSRTIFLDCTITASTKVGEKDVKGSKLPVIASKEYTCKVFLPNGYTLAISGLRDLRDQVTDTGLWPLSEIPWLGWHMFTLTTRTKVDTNSLAFLTANILQPESYDAKSKPVVLPQRDQITAAAVCMDWADGRLKDDPEALRHRAMLFPDFAKEDKSVELKPVAQSEAATNRKNWALEAIGARESGDLEAAKAACERILAQDPQDKGAAEFLAEVKASIRARDLALAKKSAEMTEQAKVSASPAKVPPAPKEAAPVLPGAKVVELR